MTRDRIAIGGLAGIDPRSVPLPHGTMVTTTVARALEGSDRVVPQGAIGRVTALLPDGRVRVAVVGRGELVYAREEVVPRKDGEVRHAILRAATEAALGRCAVLRAVVGSRAWGLSDDASDVDRRGVFLFPFPWTVRLSPPPDVIVSADGSATHWELERTLRQLLRADPNTLEMLFAPEVEVLDPVGARLLEHREAFVSQEIYGSFGRYALAQAKKLRQSLRLAEHRGKVLQWLRDEPQLELDDVAGRLAEAAVAQAQLQAKEYLKQLYRSLYDQGLLSANSFDALREFARGEAASLDLPRELRPKNAYNLLRTVSCAVQWLSTGEPLVEVSGPLRDRLLAIKRGEIPLATALAWTEAAAEGLDAARDSRALPEQPDRSQAQQILFDARAEAARRWMAREPGPWGADAAEVDDVERTDR
jgi:predicted nucleotidyltransferase